MKISLVRAPNPSLLTGPGTNTWVVSSGLASVVIDPGPIIDSHLDGIRSALSGLDPVAVLVTHTHPDHAPAANGIADEYAVPALGFSPGPDFSPDRLIADGERIGFGTAEAECLTTPGHTPDSVCYRIGDTLFSGDHIMGGSTVVVEDMAQYLTSLRRLHGIGLEALYPGHGPVIDAPDALISEYIAHRLDREEQIISAIARGAETLGEIVTKVYRDVDPALHPVAAMSVGAHLRKLVAEERVVTDEDPRWDSPVALP